MGQARLCVRALATASRWRGVSRLSQPRTLSVGRSDFLGSAAKCAKLICDRHPRRSSRCRRQSASPKRPAPAVGGGPLLERDPLRIRRRATTGSRLGSKVMKKMPHGCVLDSGRNRWIFGSSPRWGIDAEVVGGVLEGQFFKVFAADRPAHLVP